MGLGNLLGVISDVNYFKGGKRDPKAGFELLKYVRSIERYFPFLMQSSDIENEKMALELKGKFLHKHFNRQMFFLDYFLSKYLITLAL